MAFFDRELVDTETTPPSVLNRIDSISGEVRNATDPRRYLDGAIINPPIPAVPIALRRYSPCEKLAP